MCELEEESTCHALWSCRGASNVWAEESSPLDKCSSNEVELYEVWDRLVTKVSRAELELVAVVIRMIQLRRNDFLFEKKFEGLEVIFKQAEESLVKFQQAQSKTVREIMGSVGARREGRWRAPNYQLRAM